MDESANRRLSARMPAALPILIDDQQGVVRDISNKGMFVIQGKQRAMGSQIEYWIELDTSFGTMKLQGEGKVCRVEQVGSEIGIAIEILRQFGMRLIFQNLTRPH